MDKNASKINKFLVVALVAASFVIGYLYSRLGSSQPESLGLQTDQQQQQQSNDVDLKLVKELYSDGYIHFGDAKKKVLFVEVTDPSCPYCQIASGTNPEFAKQVGEQFTYKSDGGSYVAPAAEMKKLVQDGKAGYVYLFANGHARGELAAEALYCAFEKDKFWQVHDKIFSSKGNTLLNEELKFSQKEEQGKQILYQTDEDRANNINLITKFLNQAIDEKYLTECLEKGTYTEKLTRDEQKAYELQFQGTPHFIVNDKFFIGAHNWEIGVQGQPSMSELVSQALK